MEGIHRSIVAVQIVIRKHTLAEFSSENCAA